MDFTFRNLFIGLANISVSDARFSMALISVWERSLKKESGVSNSRSL
jgi:hypothetical protein